MKDSTTQSNENYCSSGCEYYFVSLTREKPSIILFDGKYQFVTTKFTLEEVKKYLPRLEKKIGISKEELLSLLEDLPIKAYNRNFYQDKLKEAKRMIYHIDKKDVDILALSLKLDCFLWSQDKDFEKCSFKKLLKTFDFIK